MGTSKTYRMGPQWAANNTNRGTEPTLSKGNIVNPEGTYVSGTSNRRQGVPKSAEKKSTSREESAKTKGTMGMS